MNLDQEEMYFITNFDHIHYSNNWRSSPLDSANQDVSNPAIRTTVRTLYDCTGTTTPVLIIHDPWVLINHHDVATLMWSYTL